MVSHSQEVPWHNVLLDTNVISELSKNKPQPQVQAYLALLPLVEGYLSLVTLGEIEKGIHSTPPERSVKLRRWLDYQLIPAYGARILTLDELVIRRWGEFMALPAVRGHNKIAVDALLAATASVHHLTLVTRNTADFALFPIVTYDPWTFGA